MRLVGTVQGHLVTLTSAAENNFAYSLLPSGSGWIGATDEASEGQWKWVTGELFWSGGVSGSPINGMYNNWTSGGEPNNSNNEDYAHFRGYNSWNDVPCSSTMAYYIVEYDVTVPEPSCLLLLGLVGIAGLIISKKR